MYTDVHTPDASALNNNILNITGSYVLLYRAVYNLVENAIKYNRPNGSVTVSVKEKNGQAMILVKDTGIGISEQHQGTIFKRFYREDAVHDVDGIGIGLYLAREIVTLQGGYIRVVSEVGKGSTFSVFLLRK